MERVIDSGNKVDFHIHSIASKHKESDDCVDLSTLDNIDTLIEKLNDRKINMCSISDHDNFDFSIYKRLKREESKGSIKKVFPAVELFKIISINMDEFGNYLEKLSNNRIPEYFDYIRMSKELGYDITDKKVLYPEDFMQEHNKFYLQYEILNNPEIENSIKSLSNVLGFNIYEDDKYMIFPADSIESIIDEGTQQHNCLRTYISSYGNNECQIYFMRTKSEKDKSFITIEVRNNKIVQARARFSEEPSEEIINLLRKWERTLLPVENE